MGSQLQITRPDLPLIDITRKPLESASLLTKCNLHPGSKSQILSLYRKYVRIYANTKFFFTRPYFSCFLKNTPAECAEPIILRHFMREGQVSLLELFSSLILFATLPWRSKARLIFYVFDFDGNRIISRD